MQALAQKHMKNAKVLHQGRNDSFFAGEEHKDFEAYDPNVDMGFNRFRYEPAPDFIQQMIITKEDEDAPDQNIGLGRNRFNGAETADERGEGGPHELHDKGQSHIDRISSEIVSTDKTGASKLVTDRGD